MKRAERGLRKQEPEDSDNFGDASEDEAPNVRVSKRALRIDRKACNNEKEQEIDASPVLEESKIETHGKAQGQGKAEDIEGSEHPDTNSLKVSFKKWVWIF